ncbi:MAG: hypothetical protein WDN24_17755 [Sphingomonas sp.]
MPPGAAELAVGHRLEPDLLLLGDGADDLLVLDLLELRGVDRAFRALRRACLSASVRSRLPTCSARKGGFRSMVKTLRLVWVAGRREALARFGRCGECARMELRRRARVATAIEAPGRGAGIG